MIIHYVCLTVSLQYNSISSNFLDEFMVGKVNKINENST